MKYVKIALWAVLIILLIIPSVLVVIFYIWKWEDNARFARAFFDDKVEVVRVVASKRWHDFSDEPIACTYAAVEFSEETADRLRAHGPEALVGKGWKRGGQERWNVRWKRTPPDSTDAGGRIYFTCLKHLPKREADLISESLRKPGSWYYEGGGISTFLSAKLRLAVTLRFDD